MDKKIRKWKTQRKLLKDIRTRLSNGEGKQAVYEELVSKFGARDLVAMLVARVTSADDVTLIKWKNRGLVILMWIWTVWTFLTKSLEVFSNAIKNSYWLFAAPLVLLWPAVMIYLITKIRKYDGQFIRLTGFLGLTAIFVSFREGY